ncbi:hypothetical protein [Bartonella australis]|uniref:hypothetical protein n=1 Tax=Bartonella australis TaxID=388640 RepID=UPI00034BD709|nr:hypothetical protein [Bartonella australis]
MNNHIQVLRDNPPRLFVIDDNTCISDLSSQFLIKNGFPVFVSANSNGARR